MEATQMITKKELAALYCCHPNTMSTRLKAIGIEPKKRISPKVLQYIYEEFGKPKVNSSPGKN